MSAWRRAPLSHFSATQPVQRLLPAPPPQHTGKLIDTPDGVRFACTRCKKLLDADGWAGPCKPVEEGA